MLIKKYMEAGIYMIRKLFYYACGFTQGFLQERVLNGRINYLYVWCDEKSSTLAIISHKESK